MVRMSELGIELCGSGDIYCLCGRVMCRASLRNKFASLFRSHRIKFHVLKNSQCRSDLESSMRRPVRHPGNIPHRPQNFLSWLWNQSPPLPGSPDGNGRSESDKPVWLMIHTQGHDTFFLSRHRGGAVLSGRSKKLDSHSTWQVTMGPFNLHTR